MNERKTYTGKFKAFLVDEYLKDKTKLNALAAMHNVHPNQIKNWKTILFKRAGEILDDHRSRSASKP
jgi:transposase-like protein